MGERKSKRLIKEEMRRERCRKIKIKKVERSRAN